MYSTPLCSGGPPYLTSLIPSGSQAVSTHPCLMDLHQTSSEKLDIPLLCGLWTGEEGGGGARVGATPHCDSIQFSYREARHLYWQSTVVKLPNVYRIKDLSGDIPMYVFFIPKIRSRKKRNRYQLTAHPVCVNLLIITTYFHANYGKRVSNNIDQ